MNPAHFVKWVFWLYPKRLFTVAKRVVVLINYRASFGLNLRLLFTPLFGDYSVVGRIVGLVVRLVEVVFGFVLLVLTASVLFVIPLLWYLLPVFLVYENALLLLAYLPAILGLFIHATKNTPEKKVAQVAEFELTKCFRRNALEYYKLFVSRAKVVPKFFSEQQITYLLIKLEIHEENFSKEVSSFALRTDKIAKNAHQFAKGQNSKYVELEHLFLAVLSVLPNKDSLLNTFGATFEDCENTVMWLVTERTRLDSLFVWQEDYALLDMGGIGKGLTGRVTPLLDSVSTDYTRLAQKGLVEDVVGRHKEIAEIAGLLSSSNENVLLLGEPGSGKTTIVKGLAHLVINGTEFKALKFKRIVALDTAALISGAKSPGEIAEKINNIMDEVKGSGDIILFFDEIHNLVTGSASEDTSSIFTLLEPHLEDSRTQFIGSTSMKDYRKYLEPVGSFARLFKILELEPSSSASTLEILQVKAREFEKRYGVTITFPALKEVIKLSEKLIHERVLPDKAIDILDRACVEGANTTKMITSKDIDQEISEVTHVPVENVSEEDAQKLLTIETELMRRVIGQDHAITQIGKALRRARVGIRDEGKPIASFLFVGTTGVGKTETAKALSATYFGDEHAMIRLDMSEYQEQDSIKRLLGDSKDNSGGQLTDEVRSKPFSLILLDEIENAYSSILLTFLQVLDDGRLTDANGVTADFTNSMIIATSNVGTKVIQDASAKGASAEELTEVAMQEVRNHFAPEFLNRFDGIIVFKPLSMESVRKIVDLMLAKVRKMAEDKKITVTFTPELIEGIIHKGYSKEWGARPMARVISDTVESYLARKILENELNMGDTIELGVEVLVE